MITNCQQIKTMELKTSNLESKERAFDDSISDIKEDLAELDSVTNALPEIQEKVKKIAIYHIFPNCMFAMTKCFS